MGTCPSAESPNAYFDIAESAHVFFNAIETCGFVVLVEVKLPAEGLEPTFAVEGAEK